MIMKDPTFLSDDEKIIYKVNKCSFAIAATIDASLKNHSDLTFQRLKVLRFLQHHPDASQIILAHILSVSPPAVTRHIAKLESEGYVQVNRSKEDARKSVILLTRKAEKEIEDASPFVGEAMKKIIKPLSDNETKVLISALDKISVSACDVIGMLCKL